MPGSSGSSSPGSSSSGNDVSDSSTLIFSQEPFEDYAVRVKTLVRTLHSISEHEEIIVDRIKGGHYNRIIGYSFMNAEGQAEKFVLRIPRFDFGRVIHDVMPLLYLRYYSELPIPQVVSFDATSQNALGRPYMIQRRIAGTPLHELYPSLRHHEKLEVARRIGEAVRFQTSAHGPEMGRLTGDLADATSRPNFMLGPLEECGSGQPQPFLAQVATKSGAQFLKDIAAHRISECVKGDTPDTVMVDHWQEHFDALTEMDDLGYMTDIPVTFCHVDFEPRNILVDTNGLQTNVSFLDWDGALFGPSFMACKPPSWIWAWHEEDEFDEHEYELKANDIPAEPDNRELKAVFEEAAGPVYMRFAYEPVYRLARISANRLASGILSNEDHKEADKMLLDWSELREKKKIGTEG